MRARRLSRRRAGSRCISSACPTAQPDRKEERKGPRVGAPDGAIQGFLKSAGLARIEDAKIVSDAQEGRVLRRRDRKARPRDARTASPRLCRRSCARFPGRNRCAGAPPRRARTRCAGCARCARSCARSAARTRRRRRSPSTLDGLTAGDVTYGHRFLAPQPIKVRRFEDYVDALAKAKVVLDADRRKQMISPTRKSLAFAQGSNSSRTKACSRKSRASSNGRSC